jgi:CheY-like chemotaxis protein
MGARILVVDDEEAVRRLLRDCLELDGYEVREAADALQAIERIAEGSRTVAITAQEIASAAARQGELAADLAGSGWNDDEVRRAS